MKILFYGDSITDANRMRNESGNNYSLGMGYPIQIAGRLAAEEPGKYEFINTGVSGDRIVDLYARIKRDVWNYEPDVLSIHIGINDVWHEVAWKNGVELERFDRVYRMMLDDTIARLPKTKIILMEPFVLDGKATHEKIDEFREVFLYARTVEKIAEDYRLTFVPLQKAMEETDQKCTPGVTLCDGVHPNLTGSAIIAEEWIKVAKSKNVI